MRPLLPHITGRRPAIGPPAGLVGVEVVEGNPQGLPDCGGRHAPASLLAGDPVAKGADWPAPRTTLARFRRPKRAQEPSVMTKA